ncbi:hypothetical protein HK100_003495 [Physocladia obscura]|uniref:Ubiquitin-like domain-containing protein n=1 Tax=Physocladia obscura TaxID=109957 RepID=A0AAD5XJA8_9FUNG|nr:hypothetical protein HK100_003495 [Physocladia obscura]
MRKLSSSPKKQSVPLENTGVTRNSPSIENPISEHNQHALDARPIHNQVEDPISIIVRVWSKESQTTPKTKLKFQVLPSHLLKSIMDKICEREGGNPESYVFFCHSIKLLPLSTVATIKAFHNPDENVKIDVYTHEHHEEMVRVRNVEFERNMSEFADKSEDGSGTGNAGSTIVGSAAVSSQAVDADDVLTVVLRDKTGAELKMRVKKSTTVGSMINAYLKKSGVVSAKMRLEFDHETLDADATVEDCGIEDDDMIDVKY